MVYDDNQGGQKPMFKGNWSCSKCGGVITELPFEPDPSRANQLQCRNCFASRKQQFNGGERQTFKGNWSCSKCGGAITELPFEPDPSRANQLQCRDCFRNSR